MDSGMDMGMDSDSSCVVAMLWNWTVMDACFISESWHIRSRGAFAASCIGVVAMMFLLEFLRKMAKDFDAHIVTTFRSRAAAIRASRHREEQGQVEGMNTAVHGLGKVPSNGTTPACCEKSPATPLAAIGGSIKLRATVLQQVIRSILYMAIFTLAYFVMLLAMYYNGYLLICIFLGSGLAHFLINGFEMDVPMEQDGGAAGGSAGFVDSAEKGSGGALNEPTVCCG
ncbi:Ctr-domain-containing protein [Microstroma glucosiphilum]|uniref:Copper transport protein n=1 Tax=Pseudomicrostroma glucosiphilum TaxID=1684307 RepID=A0A316TYC0_9BASI|nr:Ctr-domain-containing protein [Pseudomicrostroma glucosiphilum]PWN18299.1 Ctr-domain-containing protein [Pseudomicrostroma glucosiphilum]